MSELVDVRSSILEDRDESELEVEVIIDSDGEGTTSSVTRNPSGESSFGDIIYLRDNPPDMTIDQTPVPEIIIIDTEDESDICDEIQTRGNWSELPSLSIEKIYSFLCRTDQCRMSQVCQRWSQDYSSPSLWKTVKFYLPEHVYSSEIYPEIRFARKYGSMFRHVEIICKKVRTQLIVVVWRQLKLFLQALQSESHLMSLKLIKMGHYFRYLNDTMRQDVFEALVEFFRSQRNFRAIEFRDSNFTREESVELLSVLSVACKDTLMTMTLRGFVSDGAENVVSNEYSATLSALFCKLLNMQSIETDYCHIFEDMMKLLQSDCRYEIPAFLSNMKKKGTLSSLDVYCKGTRQADFRGILPSSWKVLLKICPNLRVNLDITLSTNARNDIETFIVRFMPIKSLDLRFDKSHASQRSSLSVLLNRLLDCQCNDHLESVNLFWMPIISELASVSIPFLQCCSKLETFQIHTHHIVDGIEDIFKSLLELKPRSLKSITLWFNNIKTKEEESNIARLSEEYYPLLKAVGIELFLIADPGRLLTRSRSRA